MADLAMELELKEELPEELVVKAEAELHEKPSWRTRDVLAVRDMLKEEQGLNPLLDAKYLLKFLRARKFDYDRAVSMVKDCYKLRAANESVFDADSGFLPSSGIVERATKALNIFEILPKRDAHGSVILLCRIGTWDPAELTPEEFLVATLVCLEYLSMDPATQISGVVTVIDCRPGRDGVASCSMSWSRLVKQLTPAQAKRFASFIQGHVPLRSKGIHVVGQPTLFSLALNLFRPFVSEKNFSRIHLHGEDMQSLHRHVSPDALPAEYEGHLGAELGVDHGGAALFTRMQSSVRHFEELAEHGYISGHAPPPTCTETNVARFISGYFCMR